MTGRHDNVVEILSPENLVLCQVLSNHGEVVLVFVVGDIPDDVAEGDHALDILLVPSPLQIVEQNLPGWKRGNWLPVMIFKSVVWQLEAFLWSI